MNFIPDRVRKTVLFRWRIQILSDIRFFYTILRVPSTSTSLLAHHRTYNFSANGSIFACREHIRSPSFRRHTAFPKKRKRRWMRHKCIHRRGAISNEYDKPCASNPSPSTFDWPSTQQVEYFLNATGLGWLGEERREGGVELGGGENQSAISREDESVLC